MCIRDRFVPKQEAPPESPTPATTPAASDQSIADSSAKPKKSSFWSAAFGFFTDKKAPTSETSSATPSKSGFSQPAFEATKDTARGEDTTSAEKEPFREERPSSDGMNEDGTRRRRRRRGGRGRGRGRGRGDSTDSTQSTPANLKSDSDPDSKDELFDTPDVFDSDSSEVTYGDVGRSTRRPSNVPAWAETVGVLVDANISRRGTSTGSDGRRRGRGGRGRGGGGGGGRRPRQNRSEGNDRS